MVCIIDSNPDVSGIGVRLSVYALTFIGILLDGFNQQKLHASFRFSMGLSGIAILLTAITQSALMKLTLFHHHTLVHYLLLIILPFFCSCIRNPIPRRIKFLYVLLTLAYEGWIIYFLTVLEMGNIGGRCDKFTNAGAITYNTNQRMGVKALVVGITLMTLGQLVYMLFVPAGSALRWIEGGRKELWVRRVVLAGAVWVWGVVVVFTELTVARNRVEKGEADWTFGQMLAVSMLLGPVFESVGSVTERWWMGPAAEERVAATV